jgi:hypothetical protein
LAEVEGGDLREMLQQLGPGPSLLPDLHSLIPNIRDKVNNTVDTQQNQQIIAEKVNF